MEKEYLVSSEMWGRGICDEYTEIQPTGVKMYFRTVSMVMNGTHTLISSVMLFSK